VRYTELPPFLKVLGGIRCHAVSNEIRRNVAGLIDSLSRTLATSWDEMAVCLQTELRLSSEKNKDPAYLEELRAALRILNDSPDVPTFLSAVRRRASGTAVSSEEVHASASPDEVFAEMHNEARRNVLAHWAFILAALIVGIGGYISWPWWVPIIAGVVASVCQDAAQGFRLTRDAGAGFLVRSVLMGIVMMGVFWGIGYGISRIF
jgi:hypothetical protein